MGAVARHCPRRVTPNVLSLLSGLSMILSTSCCLFATLWDTPRLFLAGAALLFVALTLDCVDGMHARNTGQATPLGAIIDHCVDALTANNCIFASYCVEASLLSGDLVAVRGFVAASCCYRLAWFTAQWSEFEVGLFDPSGVTEACFSLMFGLSAAGVFGADVFDAALTPLPCRAFTAINLGMCLSSSGFTLVQIARVLVAKRAALSKVSVAPFMHMSLHCAATMLLATSPLGWARPIATHLAACMDGTVLMTKMRLTASTRTPWPVVHLDTLPFLLLALLHGALGLPLGACTLSAVLAWQALALAGLWLDTIPRLCTALGLPFLAEIHLEESPCKRKR
eukprot:NODE_1584_length_1107_cov_287.686312.p1 GENE.NODE_1584_length_1107_cov_287.686312~~NODE_1584_length_1107_cov_287.686312.p1  ORF type:complete len:339 (-),score=99.77 NODE_1584_length_1107_cov_287.686312:73-1089(-)